MLWSARSKFDGLPSEIRQQVQEEAEGLLRTRGCVWEYLQADLHRFAEYMLARKELKPEVIRDRN